MACTVRDSGLEELALATRCQRPHDLRAGRVGLKVAFKTLNLAQKLHHAASFASTFRGNSFDPSQSQTGFQSRNLTVSRANLPIPQNFPGVSGENESWHCVATGNHLVAHRWNGISAGPNAARVHDHGFGAHPGLLMNPQPGLVAGAFVSTIAYRPCAGPIPPGWRTRGDRAAFATVSQIWCRRWPAVRCRVHSSVASSFLVSQMSPSPLHSGRPHASRQAGGCNRDLPW